MVVKIVIPARIATALKNLGTFPAHVLQGIATALDVENGLTVGHIVEARMTGTGPFPVEEGKLGVRTGRLRQSVRPSPARIVGSAVLSSIGTNVEYAAIHEFGGTIVPKNKQALKFSVGGRFVTVTKVVMPKRAPIARGIEDCVGNYRDTIGAAITKTWDQV